MELFQTYPDLKNSATQEKVKIIIISCRPRLHTSPHIIKYKVLVLVKGRLKYLTSGVDLTPPNTLKRTY